MEELNIRPSGRGFVIAGAVAALVPFVVSVSSSSSVTVNGVTQQAEYRDWIAIGGGVAAIVCGLLGLVVALRGKAMAFVAGGAVVALAGGLQIARGLGVFATVERSGSEVVDSDNRGLEAIARQQAKAASDPAKCPDGDACDSLAATLEKTAPAGQRVALGRSCDLFGHKFACLELGFSLEDRAQAHPRFLRACELGLGGGCDEAGAMLVLGDGVAKDLARGRALIEKGCNLGSRTACKNAAAVYEEGLGVEIDLVKAFEYSARACADEGDSVDTGRAHEIGTRCHLAATALRDGKLVKADPARADELDRNGFGYNRAACEATPRNCHNVALDHERGSGTPKDPATARTLYTRACDAGHASACHNLGLMLIDGEGGPADRTGGRQKLQQGCDGGQRKSCEVLKTL